MTSDESKLWEKVKSFRIDDPLSEFTFTDRLARENDWDTSFSTRVVMEYKRFMFLICVAKHPLTPSDEVDQAWHLHLLYTESYWKDFCEKTLGRSIQHGPTKGGKVEGEKFRDWYEGTKNVYKQKFGKQPPKDIWPSSEIRFSNIHFTMVNRHTHWVLPKLKWFNTWKH